MTDLVVDGKPAETPLGYATEQQANTPPSFLDAFSAQFHDASVTEPVLRWADRGAYMDTASGRLARSLSQWGAASVGAPLPFDTAIHPLPAKVLTPEEANSRYAPPGPDGKPVPIATSPLPEPVAQIIGKAKAAEIERQGVLARFGNAHSWPVTFATGTAAFMLDPLNLGSAFIPGIGEETVAARLGTGFAARTGARLVAGGTAGALSQVPVTAIRYGLGREEASDYSLRDAFRDVAFAAAGNAVVHASIGTAKELLAKRTRAPAAPMAGAAGAPGPASGELVAPSRASVEEEMAVGANAETKADAMRVAAAQIAEGKPVDVQPIMSEREAALERAQAEQTARDLAAIDAGQVPAEAQARVSPEERDRLQAEQAAREAQALQGTAAPAPIKGAPMVPSIEQLKGQAAEMTPTAGKEHLAALRARVEHLTQANPEAIAEQQRMIQENIKKYGPAPRETPAEVAERERRMALQGAAPGIPAGELERVNAEVYGTKRQEPAPAVPGRKEIAEAPAATRGKPAAEVALAGGKSEVHPEPKAIEERIAVPAVATELARMRENTGWAQEGGKHLGGEMGKPNFSTWIPNEAWWPGRPKGLSEAKAKAAITKALAGKPLNAAEKRFVEYAADVAESHAAGEEYEPTRAELKEYDVPKEQASDAALVARAGERDEAAVERAAMEHGENYAGFMKAVKEIADAETNARPQAPQPGELPAGEGAGEARGRQGEEGQPAALPGELDAELHHAEQALASARGRGEEIHHEDLAELERANAELADANAEADAMLEAATCLGEAIA